MTNTTRTYVTSDPNATGKYDAPAYERKTIICSACGGLATLRIDNLATRYECTETDCQHAVMASLIENGGDK